ncbi:hypothetical protein PFAG_03433 [Plasmodium falciparum Santa Lucia]|uniref:Uncharacterized protein n=4 Tax=Plasmodium falciparum TaxID=5833 RepID=A0A0L7LXJ3_PLAF4|nr:hypothetical protein PFFVO_05659 [Plasmodium falciparum Vietnam Oak-Knoll (FVO)]ETW42101.1 hypothetical protein PFNF135_03599 [Plasmodium falciparum NF135/5.C10]EUT83558.1 hypothetical protein PFAG_03433 [Plasmodium falciparum Santa Lucia]KOB84975.1 hypothetical protein PFDG_00320 [Plasmodium falciparum Dd2]
MGTPDNTDETYNITLHHLERERKMRNKLDVSHNKDPFDLKLYLYNACLNFSNTDIYQEYINRLSINSYNNCDYDQIKRSCYISNKDFLKYYNYNFYDNDFVLEMDNHTEDTSSSYHLNEMKELEELSEFVIHKMKKIKKEFVKNDISRKRRSEICKCTRNVLWSKEKRNTENNNSLSISYNNNNNNLLSTNFQKDNSHLFSTLIEKEKKNKNKKKNNFLYLSHIGDIKNEESIYHNEYHITSNYLPYYFFMKKNNIFSKTCNQSREHSSISYHMDDFFLKCQSINRMKLKNSGNSYYFCMLQNIEEAQNDPIVEMYYKYLDDVIKKKSRGNIYDNYSLCSMLDNTKKKKKKKKIKKDKMSKNKEMYDKINIYNNTNILNTSNHSSYETEIYSNNIINIDEENTLENYYIDMEIYNNLHTSDNNKKKDITNKINEPNTLVQINKKKKNIKRLSSVEMDIYIKTMMINEKIKSNQQRIDKRDKWNALYQFMFSCIGASLSIYFYLDLPLLRTKFDYILTCVIIFCSYIFIGLPLLQIELSLGQLSQGCILNSLSFLKKKIKGIGLLSFIILFYLLMRNMSYSITTLVIAVNSVWRPLPWDIKECEKINKQQTCVSDIKCRWIEWKEKDDIKTFKMYDNIQYKDLSQNGLLDKHPYRHNLSYHNPSNDKLQLDISHVSQKEHNEDLNIFMYSKKREPVQNNSHSCVSISTMEIILFFTKNISFVWKILSLFVILILLYFLLKIETMSLNQSLHYILSISFIIVLLQILILYYKLEPKEYTQNENMAIKYNTCIFFSKEYFLHINFYLIIKIICLVLFSVNCSTGINYIFSSYTNIGDNIIKQSYYIILGSFIVTITYLTYYYLCILHIHNNNNNKNNINVYDDEYILNYFIDYYNILPINIAHIVQEKKNIIFSFLKNNVKYHYIPHQIIIYLLVLSKYIPFSNMMCFLYFLSSLLVLLITITIHIKVIIITLKECRKFRKINKKKFIIYIIIIYFFASLLNIFFFTSYISYWFNYNIIYNIYLFIVFFQMISITWVYGSEYTSKKINHQKIYFYYSIHFFISILLLPIMIYPYYYNIYNKRYVFFILLTLNIVQFISVHIYFLYSIKLPKKTFKQKISYLYISNMNLLKRRLNNIFYGKYRKYDTQTNKENNNIKTNKIYKCHILQKLTPMWCFLLKYFITTIFIFLLISNLLHHVYENNKLYHKLKQNNYLLSYKSQYYLHNINQSYIKYNNDEFYNLRKVHDKNEKTEKKKSIQKNNNIQNILSNNTIHEYPKMGYGQDKDNYIYHHIYMNTLIYIIVTILFIIFLLLFSFFSYFKHKKFNIFINSPNKLYNINDIQKKIRKPVKFLYTRSFFFFEELLPVQYIMPSYIWTHINKHLKTESFIQSLKKEYENCENIIDKKFLFYNKAQFESYILGLICQGSRLEHFTQKKKKKRIDKNE